MARLTVNSFAKSILGNWQKPKKTQSFVTFTTPPIPSHFSLSKNTDQIFVCSIACPFNTAGAEEYIKFYTQKYDFPLVVTELLNPLKTIMESNGMPTPMARWCTRIFKNETPRRFYKYFNFQDPVQLLGITKYQSNSRNKIYTKNKGKIRVLSVFAQKSFPIYQETPIIEMPEERELELMEIHSIPIFGMVDTLGSHGCIVCPYRSQNYFKMLHDDHPALYKFAKLIQKWGSYRNITYGKKRLYWYGWNKIHDRRIKIMAMLKKQNGIKWQNDDLVPAPTRSPIKEIRISLANFHFIGDQGQELIPPLNTMPRPEGIYL